MIQSGPSIGQPPSYTHTSQPTPPGGDYSFSWLTVGVAQLFLMLLSLFVSLTKWTWFQRDNVIVTDGCRRKLKSQQVDNSNSSIHHCCNWAIVKIFTLSLVLDILPNCWHLFLCQPCLPALGVTVVQTQSSQLTFAHLNVIGADTDSAYHKLL